MKGLAINFPNSSESSARNFRVHITVRGFPLNTRFRVFAANAEDSVSFFNGEFDTGNVTTYYLTLEVPGDIEALLIRCRDSLSHYQCWERVLSVREALKQGIYVDMRPADFGKGLGEAMRKVF